MVTIEVSNLTLPHSVAILLLQNEDLTPETYKKILEPAIKQQTHYENGKLLVSAISSNSLEKVKILFELGVQLVDEPHRFLANNGPNTVFSPNFKVSAELASEVVKQILQTSGDALDIIKEQMNILHGRFNIFQTILDPAVLASLYIHLGIIPEHDTITHSLETLTVCGRAGLFLDSRESEIRDRIALQDKEVNNKQGRYNNVWDRLVGAEARLDDALNTIAITKRELSASELEVLRITDELAEVKDTLEDTKNDNDALRTVLSETKKEFQSLKQQHTETLQSLREIRVLIKSVKLWD